MVDVLPAPLAPSSATAVPSGTSSGDAAQRRRAAAVGGLEAAHGQHAVAAARGLVRAGHELYGHRVTPRRRSSQRPFSPAGLKTMIRMIAKPRITPTIWPW